MTRFNDVLTQFSEYARRTKGRRMEQVGATYLPPNLTPEQFYDGMLPLVQGNIAESTRGFQEGERVSVPVQTVAMGSMWLSMNMESKWYELGAPEFKIHPGMVEALAHTKLEIPGREVFLPYPVFAIRLPRHHLREHEDAPWVKSLMVGEIYERQLGAERRKFCVVTMFEPNVPTDDPFEFSITTKFELDMSDEGALNVGECVAHMPLGLYDDGYWPGREMTTELVALAISTALIGVGGDEEFIKRGSVSAVERTKRRKIIKRHGPASAGADRPFEVGADILLPRRERNYGRPEKDKEKGEKTESGRHLRYSHIRSGHIRMQRYKNKETGAWMRKPKFIKPMIVGKGKPLKPKATPRKIVDPKSVA